jgi:mannose-1-phosphate guanylyltransferase
MANEYYVVIMAGGIGSRFWPLSKTSHPKQFLDILGTGKSLITQTFERFNKLVPAERIFVVTNQMYIDLVKEHLPQLPHGNILGEPSAKNTAPCIAYATYKIRKINPDACCVVAPSDHLILNEQQFLDDITTALEFSASNDALVSLGIKPTRPDTGYGYIQFLEGKNENDVHKVKTFTEKPNLELAQKFVESGEFLWNAGIFIWSIGSIVNSFDKFLPDLSANFESIEAELNTPAETDAIVRVYPLSNSISIDYGVLEKADNVYVIPCDFGWSDLGTWSSLFEVHDKDEHGNAVNASTAELYDTRNCMIDVPKGKLIVINGLKDKIIVDTDKVLLICDKNREQEVKQIVTNIKLKLGEKYL